MKKVILCVFVLLAIFFGAVLGVLYPPKGATRLIKNNTPLPHTQLDQTPSPSSTRFINFTEEDKPTTPSSSEVNGNNLPPPSKSPFAASASDEDPTKAAGGVLAS